MACPARSAGAEMSWNDSDDPPAPRRRRAAPLRAVPAAAAAEQVREQRERYADFYRTARWRFRLRFDCRQRRHALRAVLDRLGLPPRDLAVLDVGFGSGDLLFLFEPSCRLGGVEVSTSAIDAAREIAGRAGYRQHEFREAPDDGRLPFPDRHYDLVICSHVLEHVPDDRRTLAEIRRVLRPGGYAILFVPVEPEGFDPKHRRLYGVRSLVERVRRAGLVPAVVEAQMCWAWPLRFLEIPALHGGGTWRRVCDGLRHLLAVPLPMPLAARFDRTLARVGVPGTQALVVAARP